MNVILKTFISEGWSDVSQLWFMKALRIGLGVLLSIICINAIGGGYYGMSGPKGIPLEWLKGSPFTSYFFPSLFLFAVIGGTCLTGAVMAFRSSRYTRTLAFLCAVLLLCWIFIQVRIIGYVSWMQPAIFVSGLVVFVLAYLLPGKTSLRNK